MQPREHGENERPRRRYILRLFISVFLVFFLVFVVSGGLMITKSLDVLGVNFVEAWQIIRAPYEVVKNSEGRTNVLILGQAGGDHAGAELTDTMIIGSLRDGDAPALVTLPLPRDIWSEELHDKINSAYYYGNLRAEGGLAFVKTIISKYTGLPIHYVILLDFSGFERVIDVVGGVEVTVEDGFTDHEYPIAGRENDDCGGDMKYGCRFETVSFLSGLQQMDGATALKFVRSRHANGDEGTDFARGRRQQAVFSAIRAKLIEPTTWLDRNRSQQIVSSLLSLVISDSSKFELYALAWGLVKVPQDRQINVAIDDSLFTPNAALYGGRYVLVPRSTQQEFQELIKQRLFSF